MNRRSHPWPRSAGKKPAARGRKEVANMPRYTVVCEWRDRGDFDADDVVVVTDTPEAAIDRAKKKWRLTIGAEWPQARLTDAWVVTPEKRAEFA